jgi:beta-phosphoglucomutase
MDWINRYDLFLFDFDGLLVDTESLHHLAYKNMCSQFGVALQWDINRFYEVAHFNPSGIKNALYQEYPQLRMDGPDWNELYSIKKEVYQQLLAEGVIDLMPGAAALLSALNHSNILRAVVTNSSKTQIDAIKLKIPLLQTIPLWITREDYSLAKPDPECYRMAIDVFKDVDRGSIVGFEDSARGVKALLGAEVPNVFLICPSDHPQMKDPIPAGVRYVSSFSEIS